MLLVGQRKSETLSEDVDIEQRIWRIPETKADRSHTVPLPAPIIERQEKLPMHDGNPYVFVGHKKGDRLRNVQKKFVARRKTADLHDLRLHDLRRTLGSWLAGEGHSLPIIGRALGHTQASTTQIYARLQLNPVRAALEANAQKMLQIENGEKKESSPKAEEETGV